ncbi:MAG: tetratricopeptide repeat protein [Bacteroidia bacterium]|nr:tetratricopeptide repeat protein [Bacteroidia bacterium]
MNKHFILIWIYLFGMCSITYAWPLKESETDSLKKLLDNSLPDTAKVQLLFKIAEGYYQHSPAAAIPYFEEAEKISKQIRYSVGLTNAYGWLAYLYEQSGNIGKALDFNYNALELARKSKDKKNEAILLGNIAAIYKDQGRIEEALNYNFRSLEIRKTLNDSAGISTILNNIGLIYAGQGRIEEALNYYQRSLFIEENLKSNDGVITAMQNIGAVYREQKEYESAFAYYRRALEKAVATNSKYSMGYIYNGLGGMHEENSRFDSALHYFNNALALRTELDDKQGIAYTLKNKGIVYQKTSAIAEAENAFRKSLAIFQELGDKLGTATVANLLGASFLEKKNYPEAQTYLQFSLKKAMELGFPAPIGNAAGNLLKLYRDKGDWHQAFLMYDLYITMRDSIQNDLNRKAALKSQFQYEYEKRETLIKIEQEKKQALSMIEIKKNRQQKYFLLAGLLLVMIFAYLNNRKKKQIANEKKRSDELLLNILPAEIAAELKSKGTTRARHYKEVTVMFTDFIDFTVTAEKLSPQDLVNEINFCYIEFDKIISKYGIEKIKTIGDAYMCAGGLPVPTVTNAEDTIRAAMDIRAFMLRESQVRKTAGKSFFEIRIGIHTGPVVAGIVGIKKYAYDIWGDTVNIASRMESSGETGKINISGATFELVKNKFTCVHRGKIQAKNKGEIDMYFVENA